MKFFKKKKKKEGAEGEEKEEEGKTEEKEEGSKEEAKEGGEAKEGEAKEGEGGEGAPAKKSKKKIIIIGILALVVLLGGAGGAYYAGIFGKGSEKAEGEGGIELDKEGKPILKVVYYTLPEFLVNLNVGGKQTSFLKTTIILELTKQLDVSMVEANLPRLLDAFNTYLRELRASDLAGSAGIQRLREELLLRANKALAPTKVNDILFKEIVIQ